MRSRSKPASARSAAARLGGDVFIIVDTSGMSPIATIALRLYNLMQQLVMFAVNLISLGLALPEFFNNTNTGK